MFQEFIVQPVKFASLFLFQKVDQTYQMLEVFFSLHWLERALTCIVQMIKEGHFLKVFLKLVIAYSIFNCFSLITLYNSQIST